MKRGVYTNPYRDETNASFHRDIKLRSLKEGSKSLIQEIENTTQGRKIRSGAIVAFISKETAMVYNGHRPHTAGNNQTSILKTTRDSKQIADRKYRRASGDRSRVLPLVYEFICERVTRLSLHNVRFCLLVSQGNGGHLHKH